MLRIHLAAEEGNCEEIKTVHAFDPNLLDIKDDRGSTAMHIAAKHGRAEAVKLLFELGSAASRIPDNVGHYPVHLAAASKSWDTMKVFCDLHPHSLSLKAHFGQTAFDFAVIFNARRLVALFHARGKAVITPTPVDSSGFFIINEHSQVYARRLHFSRSLAEVLFFAPESIHAARH